MDTVAIVGVGLIGGSFALAIRRAGFSGTILGVSSPSTIAQAIELNVIDRGVTLEEACAQADLVYLAQPILRIIELLPRIGPLIRSGMLVTDAGSTKEAIVAAAQTHLPPGSFLGGHPMAGKETRGPAAADARLFEGRPYVITPVREEDLNGPIAQELLGLLPAIGSRLVFADPSEHDRIVAYTSHLPQLISTALALSVNGVNRSAEVCGPSVLDLTRLAFSSYDMWGDILQTNRANIRASVLSFIEILDNLGQRVGSDMRSSFSEASEAASLLRNNR